MEAHVLYKTKREQFLGLKLLEYWGVPHSIGEACTGTCVLEEMYLYLYFDYLKKRISTVGKQVHGSEVAPGRNERKSHLWDVSFKLQQRRG